MRRFLSLTALFGTIAVLLVLMVWLRNFEFGDAPELFHPKSLAATGFIILAAFSMGEFFKLFNVPALLGYIAAGILFGPNLAPMLPGQPEALFSQNVIENLALINVLTVGVIGTMGGGELKISDLKDNIKTILLVSALVILTAVPITFGAVILLSLYAPQFVPFLADAPMEHVYAGALVFGVFGMAMSPSVTLAILQETRAKGKLSSLILGIVVIADLMLVLLFLIALQFAKLLISPAGFNFEALSAQLPVIAAEFGWALVIGIGCGLIFIVYLQFVAREKLLFTVALIFATAYVAELYHAETLLAFLTAGFIVQNFSRLGHDMIHALEKISLPVFVIYFMTQAAQLDLQAAFGFIWLTLILSGLRGLALYSGARFGTRWTDAPETQRRYLWLGLFSLGSVDLVLAAKAAADLGELGEAIQTVILGTVCIHILLGPYLLKIGLDRGGETETSRRSSQREAEAFDLLPSVREEHDALAASFPVPAFEDGRLNTRMTQLRGFLAELHREHIVEPVQARSAAMRTSLDETSQALHAALEALEAVLSSDEYETDAERAEAVTQVHVEYLEEIADNVRTWEHVEPATINARTLTDLIAAIRSQEAFGTVYRVQWEDYQITPAAGDSLLVRTAKLGRKMRSFVLGPGTRSIPLGRLWRYYVELTVPRYMARAVVASAEHHETLWSHLGNHLRRNDDLFDELYDVLTAEAPVTTPEPEPEPKAQAHDDAHDTADHEAHDDGHDAQEPDAENGDEGGAIEDAPPTRVEVAREKLAQAKAAAAEREAELEEDLSAWVATTLDRFTVSMRETFANFLEATQRAGTLELPAFRYRPSALFDRSRRAENLLQRRVTREQTVVTGHRGWIVLDYQLILFLYWLDAYESHAQEALESMLLDPALHQLTMLRAQVETLPEEIGGTLEQARAQFEAEGEQLDAAEPASEEERAEPVVDWERWLNEHVRPALRRARRAFQHTLVSYGQGVTARRLLEVLEGRVGQFSDEIILLSQHPDAVTTAEKVPTLRVPMREWFVSEVVRETALRFVEFNERGESLVRHAVDQLEDIQQVLEFNLLTAQHDNRTGDYRHANDVATGGLARALRMVDELYDDLRQTFRNLEAWLVEEADDIAERATDPFLQHRLAEIERLLARRGQATLAERGETWAAGRARDLARLTRRAWRRISPLAREAVADLRSLFARDVHAIDNAEIRERLFPYARAVERRVPAIYRRLFTPVPLDIPDFYVPRERVEQRCLQAIVEWQSGRTNAILVTGDRGAGKRSTIHHLLQTRVETLHAFDAIETHTLLLEEDTQAEADLARQIGAAFTDQPPDTLEGLDRLIHALPRRHIVIIENGEKLYSRTKEGIGLCRRALRMMDDTSDHVLWLVLMGTPAATYLDMALGLGDFFTHRFHIESLGVEDIRTMILKRHRVSGFRASYERPSPRFRDWMRHPYATSEAMRDPRGRYFDHLARISGGNPMLALLYWLESAEQDEEEDHLIHVSMLPDQEIDVVAPLSLLKRLILTALVQHHSLTPLQLRVVLRQDFESIQTELDHLERLGFVERVAGRQMGSYHLRPIAEALVTRELRARNMV